MQRRTSLSVAVAVAVGYVVFMIFGFLLSGVSYDDSAATAGNFLRSAVVPTLIAAAILIFISLRLGWWQKLVHEDLRTARWLRAVPILMLIGLFLALLTANWSAETPFFIICVAIGTLLIGFNEELVFRGYLLTGLRGNVSEFYVWLFSTLAFSLAHGTNFFLGQELGPTFVQMIFAFCMGTIHYVVRRVTGTIFLCMLIHALWDFSAFIHGSGTASALTTSLGSFSQSALGIIALIMCFVAMWKGLFSLPRRSAPQVR